MTSCYSPFTSNLEHLAKAPREQERRSWRGRLVRFFLWVWVLGGGILLGGELFDQVVLVGAWSASPPASLGLLPYGPD